MRVALGVACVVALIAADQARPAPQSQPPAMLKSGGDIILGRVVEADTTTGVAGASVSLMSSALGMAPATFDNGRPAGMRIATTNSDGQFLFRDLPAGAYEIEANARGFVSSWYGVTRMVAPARQEPRRLELTDGDKPANLTIRMWKLGGLGGRLLDESGDPMVGVDIYALERVTDWTGTSFRTAGFTTTDDRGVYHFDVTPGDYTVGVMTATTTMSIGGVESYLQAQREGGRTLQDYENRVREKGAIVPRGYGTRVGAFVVSQLGFMTTTPVVPPIGIDHGAAWFYPSTFHPSSLTPAGATFVRVTSGDEKGGVDVTMRPVPARRVSGRVVGPDGPLENVLLTLAANDPVLGFAGSLPALLDTPMAMADANGDFAFIGVAPGSYTLCVKRDASGPAYDDVLWASLNLTVGEDRDVGNLDIRLQRGARVFGRVVVEAAASPPPQPRELVFQIIPRSVASAAAASVMNSRLADMNWMDGGQFSTHAVPPGPCVIDVSLLGGNWVVKSVTIDGRNVMDKPFDLEAGGAGGAVVTVTDRVSVLRGAASDSNGAPASAATVVVFPVDRTLWPIAGLQSRLVKTAAPGKDGRYEIRGLPAGDYYVVAADWPSADFSDAAVLTALIPTASRVTIGDGTSHTQDVRVTVRR